MTKSSLKHKMDIIGVRLVIDPGHFYAVCRSGVVHRNRTLRRLERELKALPAEPIVAAVGDVVCLIADVGYSHVMRGYVKSFTQTESTRKYVVYLIDDGSFVETDQIFKLPAQYQPEVIPGFSIRCGVFGVVPASKVLNISGSGEVYSCDSWSQDATCVVQELLNCKTNASFHLRLEFNGIAYGDIILEDGTNIADVLVGKHMALRNDKIFFERIVNVNTDIKDLQSMCILSKCNNNKKRPSINGVNNSINGVNKSNTINNSNNAINKSNNTNNKSNNGINNSGTSINNSGTSINNSNNDIDNTITNGDQSEIECLTAGLKEGYGVGRGAPYQRKFNLVEAIKRTGRHPHNAGNHAEEVLTDNLSPSISSDHQSCTLDTAAKVSPLSTGQLLNNASAEEPALDCQPKLLNNASAEKPALGCQPKLLNNASAEKPALGCQPKLLNNASAEKPALDCQPKLLNDASAEKPALNCQPKLLNNASAEEPALDCQPKLPAATSSSDPSFYARRNDRINILPPSYGSASIKPFRRTPPGVSSTNSGRGASPGITSKSSRCRKASSGVSCGAFKQTTSGVSSTYSGGGASPGITSKSSRSRKASSGASSGAFRQTTPGVSSTYSGGGASPGITSKSSRCKKASSGVSCGTLRKTSQKVASAQSCGNFRKGSPEMSMKYQPGRPGLQSGNFREINSAPAAAKTCSLNERPPAALNSVMHKYKCNCSVCSGWENNSLVFEKKKAAEKASLKVEQTEAIHPGPLLKSEEEPGTKEVMSRNISKEVPESCKDMLNARPMLVHGLVASPPCTSVADCGFHKEVFRTLTNLEITTAKPLQMYTWPIVLRGQHLVMVDYRGNGRTMAYMAPLCSMLLHNYSPRLKTVKHPLSVIVTSDQLRGDDALNRCRRLLMHHNYDKLTITACFPPLNDAAIRRKMQQGCDLLVTTAELMDRLIDEQIINLRHLMFLAVEAGSCDSKTHQRIERLLKLCDRVQKARTKPIWIQVVIVSSEWNDRLENLAKMLLKPPVVCIGAFLEAAIYGRAVMQLSMVDSSNKLNTLMTSISGDLGLKRCAVICADDSEVRHVAECIELKGFKTICGYSDISKTNIYNCALQWRKSEEGDYPVLVVVDLALAMGLYVTDASVVVQYSMPKTWGCMNKRFSTMIDCYRSPWEDLKKHKASNPRMHILLDELNELNLPRLFGMLMRFPGVNITPQMLQLNDRLLKERELVKVKQFKPLCRNIQLLGACPDTLDCKDRHLPDLQADVKRWEELPSSGTVWLQVVKVLEPNTFSCRLVNNSGDDQASLALELSELQASDYPVPAGGPVVGHRYLCEKLPGNLVRCEVLDVYDPDNLGLARRAKVLLLETGEVLAHVKASRLRWIPPHLESLPGQYLLVHVLGLVPPNGDAAWSQWCLHQVRNRLETLNMLGCNARVEVVFRLDRILWVQNLYIYQRIELNQQKIVTIDLRGYLLKTGIGVEAPDVVERLYRLCDEAGIPYQTAGLEEEAKSPTAGGEVQKAFFDMSVADHAVYFRAGNPGKMFLRLIAFDQSLMKLNVDMTQAAASKFYPRLRHPLTVNSYCLVLEEEESVLNRARIVSVDAASAYVFFVDEGDSARVPLEKILHMEERFLARLPLQAIECRLHGVAPVDGRDWCEKSVDILYDLTFMPKSQQQRALYVVPVQVDDDGVYSIILVDSIGRKSVNRLLVDHGLAVVLDEAKIDAEIALPPVKVEDEGTEESEEPEDEGIDDDDRWDCYADESFLDLLSTLKIPAPSKCDDKGSVPMQAPPRVECKAPTVVWHQTERLLTLRLQPAAEGFEVRMEGIVFIFSCIHNDERYELKRPLSQPVFNQLEKNLAGSEARVVLVKKSRAEWDCLFADGKSHNVRYDLDVEENDPDCKKSVRNRSKEKLICSSGAVSKGSSGISQDVLS